MESHFKIGDYVEHCSLMPGVLMAIDGDDVEIRILGDINYKGDGFACCSIQNCGVRKLPYNLVKMMMVLGNEKLGQIYRSTPHFEKIDEFYQEYDKRIQLAYFDEIKEADKL